MANKKHKTVDSRIEAADRTGATALDLSRLGLTTLPESIGRLAGLQTLHLGGNQLATLPESIGRLAGLQTLSLRFNQLATLPESIGGLAKLQALHLGGNRLATLPESIGRLTGLQALNLGVNRLATLPESIGRLTGLQALDLGGNRLATLPESIGRLTGLQTLDLSVNRLATLPESIGGLTGLQALELGGNQLATLPESIGDLVKLEALYLHENERLGLPPEVLGPIRLEVIRERKHPARPADILDYLRRLRREQRRRLNEVKVLVLGQPQVGKTALIDYLVNDQRCDPERMPDAGTKGIKIANWVIAGRSEREEDRITLRIWDFGGQEIMHPTHQFFLTERCLYLVVLAARQEEEEGRLEYWLRLIQSLGADAPVIVVVNKIDQLSLSLDQTGLVRQYAPNLHQQRFAWTSCADGRGIAPLKEKIRHEALELTAARSELPQSYFDVKSEVEGTSLDWMTYEQYESICRKHRLDDATGQDALLRLLNELGVVICFRDDPRLEYMNILDPGWATEGIYAILTNQAVQERQGDLERRLLAKILDRARYPAEKHQYLLDLMEKFELGFAIDGSDGQSYLLTGLLDRNEPEDLDWDGRDAVAFLYEYSVLPNSVISRFLARNHQLLDREKKTYWRHGAILNLQGSRALVRADYADRRMTIAVTGPSAGRRRGAMVAVCTEFERIHAALKKITITRWVPLRQDPSILLNYEELLTFEAEGIATFPKAVGGRTVQVNVREHLDGIADEVRKQEDQRRLGITNVYNIDRIERAEFRGMGNEQHHSQSVHIGGNVTGSTLNLGEIRGRVINTVSQIADQPGCNVAELRDLIKTLADLIMQAEGQVPAEAAQDALQEIEAVAKGAQDPASTDLLEQASRALRSLKRMAGDFSAVTAAGTTFAGLVGKIADWWKQAGW